MSGEVAYVECLQAQEAAYWDGRRRGSGLTDKQIGDVLRAAAPHLRECWGVDELQRKVDELLPIVATLAIYGEQANVPELIEKARALNMAMRA
jgi:hypothetical protein